MGFKERLRQARYDLRYTGDYVGSQVGVSKATVSHWENGRYEPNIEQIKGLCNVLRVSADWLFEREALDLTADAIEEARAYMRLSPDDKKRWKAMRKALFATA